MLLDYIKREIKLKVFQPYWNLKGNFKYYNQKVYFPKNSVIFERAVIEGIYEQQVLSVICPLIKPNTEVFDIGANIGIMAIPMLSCDESVKVVSVEASPNSLPFLKQTNFSSGYKNRWFIIDKAVSDKEGKINFHIAASKDGAYDSINDTKRISFAGTIEIDCTTIDHIWSERGKPKVSVIKCDIEGADLLALKGGVKCIVQCKPSIVIEWNQVNIKPFGFQNKDLFDFAQSINYVLFALPGLNKITNLNDLELYSKYTENMLLMPGE